jgi:hypothetical protein
MREFASAMVILGHEVILLTEAIAGAAVETTPEQTRKKIQNHNFSAPLYLSAKPEGHHLIKKLRDKKLPWGIRQAIIIWYFFYHKGVFTDWRTGCQPYLHPIAEYFKPDLIWATFSNTDTWNIAKDLASIANVPWVGDIKDPWGIFIPAPFRKYLAKYFDNCVALSTFSDFNSIDAQKWFKAPKTVIYSGFWENQLDRNYPLTQNKINISLTGGIYDRQLLDILFEGIKIWLEGLPQKERSKVYLKYAGNDTESVKGAAKKLTNLCNLNLLGFISVKELQKVHQTSIANLYIKINRTFHHKAIEILSAGRPVICYPEESNEVINIAKATNIALHSCSSPENISEALSQSLNTASNKVNKNKRLKELTWNFQARKLEALFQNIIPNS